MMQKLIPVKSSSIRAIGHDPATNTLAVDFHDGGLYHLADVTADQHRALMTAESHGKHYGKHFRGNSRHKVSRPRT